MKALLINNHEIKVGQKAKPVAGKGEIIIRVHAAGLNPADFKLAKWFQLPPNTIPGFDVSGVVESVGPETAKLFSIGDEVVFFANVGPDSDGGFCEFVRAKESVVFKKPKTVSFVDEIGRAHV